MNDKDILKTKKTKEIQKCESCKKVFAYKSSLIKHARIHTGEKPYSCDVISCNQKFSQISNLIRHKRIHDGIRPYLCKICLKSFSSTSNLKQHENIHKKVNTRFKYTCFIKNCDKHYFYVCTLKKHLVSMHYNFFHELTNYYPGKNFYEIYKVIKTSHGALKTKFEFLDFKSNDSTCEEEFRERRKKIKCRLSIGRSFGNKQSHGNDGRVNLVKNEQIIKDSSASNLSSNISKFSQKGNDPNKTINCNGYKNVLEGGINVNNIFLGKVDNHINLSQNIPDTILYTNCLNNTQKFYEAFKKNHESDYQPMNYGMFGHGNYCMNGYPTNDPSNNYLNFLGNNNLNIIYNHLIENLTGLKNTSSPLFNCQSNISAITNLYEVLLRNNVTNYPLTSSESSKDIASSLYEKLVMSNFMNFPSVNNFSNNTNYTNNVNYFDSNNMIQILSGLAKQVGLM